MISKVGHFQGKSFRLFAVALRLFPPLDGTFSVALHKRRAAAVKGEKTPSSGGNVNFANGQTDKTLMPYKYRPN
jgi:hypothetical protein